MEELVIGRYRVIRKLSTGGMAEVYAAKHELMDRSAAVKLLLPEMSVREDIVRRFFQEAQAAARIDHPGIVQVFDVGYTPGGRAYLVMEMLAGEPLGRRLQRQGALSLAATLILIRQLAGAMDAAHRRGIIHRDLKPDNLFLVPDPEMPQGERVKVLDFGLAKLLGGSSSAMELTAQGAVFGTPSFMAPEQCQSAANVDGRADLYSIGCIFYACLCGQPPFSGDGIGVLMAHVGELPVPPRQRVPAIPPAFEALILRLLEKDPGRRLPSCAALIAEIDHAVAVTGLALDVADQRHGSAASDEVTIREEPIIKGTFAAMAETRRLSPLPRTLVPAAGFMELPALAPAALPALAPADWPRELVRGPGFVPRPPAESESDTRQAARPSTPTIDNGELEVPLRRDGNRRLWWLAGAGLLGALMVAGVVVGPDEEPSGMMEPIVHVPAEKRAQTDETDTRGEAPSSWPVIARPLTEIDHLLEQAESAISRRAWNEALRTLRAARQHEDMDEKRLARVLGLAQGARAGQQHQAALERLRAAEGTQRLETMADAYAEIPEDSIYHTEARALYESARQAWLEEMRQRAQRLVRQGDCEALAGVVTRVSRLVPDAEAELQARSAACVPALDSGSAGNHAPEDSRGKILARVRAAHASGRTALALQHCIDSWQIVARDGQLAAQCGVVACKAKNRQAARWHYNHTSQPQHRSTIEKACRTESLDVK
jgi:tRNA A-37 threonylcarbamoyl transferase component Bud32